MTGNVVNQPNKQTNLDVAVGGKPPPDNKKNRLLMDELLEEYISICLAYLSTVAKAAAQSGKETREHIQEGQAVATVSSGLAESIGENSPKAPSSVPAASTGTAAAPEEASGSVAASYSGGESAASSAAAAVAKV